MAGTPFASGFRPRLNPGEDVLYAGRQHLGPVLFRALGVAGLVVSVLGATYAIIASRHDIAMPPREFFVILIFAAIPAVVAELRRSYRGLELTLTDSRMLYRWGWPRQRKGEIPVASIAAIEGDLGAPFTVYGENGEELWVYGLRDLDSVRRLIETAARQS